MVSENAREQLLFGYRKAVEGLNEHRTEDWTAFESVNESLGALAAIVFYGACVRENLSQGIDDPNQADMLALAFLAFFEEDDFDSVVSYLVGNPLPSRISEMIEHYKTNLQSDVASGLSMLDNLEINFGSDDDSDSEEG